VLPFAATTLKVDSLPAIAVGRSPPAGNIRRTCGDSNNDDIIDGFNLTYSLNSTSLSGENCTFYYFYVRIIQVQ
jgi:hypothetical protein